MDMNTPITELLLALGEFYKKDELDFSNNRDIKNQDMQTAKAAFLRDKKHFIWINDYPIESLDRLLEIDLNGMRGTLRTHLEQLDRLETNGNHITPVTEEVFKTLVFIKQVLSEGEVDAKITSALEDIDEKRDSALVTITKQVGKGINKGVILLTASAIIGPIGGALVHWLLPS